MLCFTQKRDERLIEKLSLSPPLSEIPSAVTSDIFNDITGKLGPLVIIEVDCDIHYNFNFPFDSQLRSLSA